MYISSSARSYAVAVASVFHSRRDSIALGLGAVSSGKRASPRFASRRDPPSASEVFATHDRIARASISPSYTACSITSGPCVNRMATTRGFAFAFPHAAAPAASLGAKKALQKLACVFASTHANASSFASSAVDNVAKSSVVD
eukprot:31532-Pelagococcus_subviridis.AAC.14